MHGVWRLYRYLSSPPTFGVTIPRVDVQQASRRSRTQLPESNGVAVSSPTMSAAQHEFDDLMRNKDRRTVHPEDDNDDARSFLNLSDDESENTTPAVSNASAAPRPSTSLARSTIPTTRYEANTGPKGVIADAQHFRDSRRSHRNSIRSGSTLPSQLQAQRASNPVVLNEKITESDEEAEDDEADDDFMHEWRQSRLKEMQSGAPREGKAYSRGKSKRLWGGLATVDGMGYLDAVDNSPPDTVVVVYIYDDYVGFYNFCEREVWLLIDYSHMSASRLRTAYAA